MKCDFCKQEFEPDEINPVICFLSKKLARIRPQWAAAKFPWNMKKLPRGTTFTPESLRVAGVIVRTACVNCFREVERDQQNDSTIHATSTTSIESNPPSG